MASLCLEKRICATNSSCSYKKSDSLTIIKGGSSCSPIVLSSGGMLEMNQSTFAETLGTIEMSETANIPGSPGIDPDPENDGNRG